MDSSRRDYSMSGIGLTLADQNEMYSNTAAIASLGGRPQSAGVVQSMNEPRPSGIMSNAPQGQSLSNSAGSNAQQRGIKRAGTDCYNETHHLGVGNIGFSSGVSSVQSLDNSGAGNVLQTDQRQMELQQPQSSGSGVSEAAHESYNITQSKKSPPANGKKTKGRVKIKMEYIDNKLRRYTTFSKRKTGIMKKAYELSTLTGTQVMLLVASETGHVYTFATRKLQPMITSEAGKQLIQTCLNSPDPPSAGGGDQRMSATGFEETELSYNIADEDSKEIRSPLSSVNDSDDSSDLENTGAINNCDVNNSKMRPLDNRPETEAKFFKSSLKTNNVSIPTVVESTRQEIQEPPNHNPNKVLNLSENVFHPSSDLSNVPQGVLLQLIEAGHLQVHTEEDGSGHQYVAIPLHPSTVNMLHSNKSTTNTTFTQADEKIQYTNHFTANAHANIQQKPTPPGIIIKQEFNE